MNKKNVLDTESVKIKREIVNLVRKDKETSGIPIGKFFEIAAVEKLSKSKKK